MGVTVRIPTPLRRMTGGADKVELDVADLSQMIDRLESDYPGFKERLLDEEGELRYFVNIYVNGEDIPGSTRGCGRLSSPETRSALSLPSPAD